VRARGRPGCPHLDAVAPGWNLISRLFVFFSFPTNFFTLFIQTRQHLSKIKKYFYFLLKEKYGEIMNEKTADG
jgi:hypothetical protein